MGNPLPNSARTPRNAATLDAWRTIALPLALIGVIALCWIGLASTLAGARAAVYPLPRVTIHVASGSGHPHVGDPVHFTAQRLAGASLSYTWEFGDGAEAFGPRADHSFTDPGAFHVTLVVSDSIGQQITARAAVTIYPPLPVATFQWNGGASKSLRGRLFLRYYRHKRPARMGLWRWLDCAGR